MEIPEINSHIHSLMIFYKSSKDTQWGKDSLFNKWCWKIWMLKEEIKKMLTRQEQEHSPVTHCWKRAPFNTFDSDL